MTDKKVESNKNSREIALGILVDITENSNFSHTVISKTLKEYQQLTKQDRAFITRVCEGTIERLITIDYIINFYSNVKVRKMKPFIRNLLRMSVYQIKYMEGTPDSAVCNEAVKLAKKRGFTNLSGFVNGVLRNVVRDPDKVVMPDENKEPVQCLSIYYSVPEWLVGKLLKQYSTSIVKGMLESFLDDKVTTIRCNSSKTTTEEMNSLLMNEGVNVESGAYLPYAFKISEYNYLSSLESFQKGLFLVQDESSMLVGQVSGVKEGDYVIDVCAAPGGKSLHVADLLHETGHVNSRDVSDYKTSFIQDNIKRLGYTNMSVKVQDALDLDKDSIEKADLLIADLPCSGLGVIGKKPDIKYNMTEEKIHDLVKLQRSILEVVQLYVKNNGTLLYSTCTINQEENVDNLNWFTENFPFKLESLDDFLPKELVSDTTSKGYIQLIPGVHSTDGFFIAKLRKCEV